MDLEQSLKAHFLNLYHMALSDTEVDPMELEMLYKIGEEKGVSKVAIDDFVIRPDAIKFNVPESVLEKMESLYDLARIAWADGRIDPNEQRVMEMFCKKYGFETVNIPTIVQFLLDEAEKKTSKEEIFRIVEENA